MLGFLPDRVSWITTTASIPFTSMNRKTMWQPQIHRLLPQLLLMLLVIAVILFSWQRITPAQINQSDLRVSRLESELLSLRSRLSQIEAALGRTSPNPDRSSLSAPSLPAPAAGAYPTPAMFDRLATLVIELRERVNGIDARVVELERQGTR